MLLFTYSIPIHELFMLRMYVGSEFYIGFIPNFGEPLFIVMLTNGEVLTTYSIEAGFYQNGTMIANVQNVVNIPNALSGLSYAFSLNSENDKYKEGVYIQTSKNRVATIGSYHNGDTFFAIPTIDLCLKEYTYFAMSVGTITRWSDGSVVLVATANQTILNITVPVSDVQIKINNSVDWSPLVPDTLYTYEIQRLQIVYIAVLISDLTGTKVTTNKPISLFSGHECGFIPSHAEDCGNLMEQIPPTELWGTVYYFAPLASRTSYTIKIIAAYDSTTVDIYCYDSVSSHIINAGGFVNVTYSNQEFCGVTANQVVLVTQFSHAYDSYSQGNPMMTLIPATSHYTNSITSSTVKVTVCYDHYINIIVLASYYQPEMISITTAGGMNQSFGSQSWVPIIRNGVTEAYAAQVNIPHGVFEVTHVNDSALMTVVVYGFESQTPFHARGYGHPGWLMDRFNDGTDIIITVFLISNNLLYVCTYVLKTTHFLLLNIMIVTLCDNMQLHNYVVICKVFPKEYMQPSTCTTLKPMYNFIMFDKVHTTHNTFIVGKLFQN